MKSYSKRFPDSPGVYFFKQGKTILYIGKATSLRDRVRSYFNLEVINSRGPVIAKMFQLATEISFKKTDSVLEAVILEAELIKEYQPRFNSREKDDKSFYYIVITKESFPKVLQIRGRNLQIRSSDYDIKKRFGPFPSATELKEALRTIRKLFPFRDKCRFNQGGPCFNFQVGLCPGICLGIISESDYGNQIKNIELFLSGKKKVVIKLLKKEMGDLATRLEFEEADKIKRRIFALEHIQDVSLIKRKVPLIPISRIEAYDVAHQSGTNNVGVMICLKNGQIDRGEYRKFKIRGDSGADDLKSLKEILERRFKHSEWQYPDILVVDGGKLQLRVAKDTLKGLGFNLPIVAVVKDDRHKPNYILGDIGLVKKYESSILLANFEAHNYAINHFRKLANRLE